MVGIRAAGEFTLSHAGKVATRLPLPLVLLVLSFVVLPLIDSGINLTKSSDRFQLIDARMRSKQ